LDLENKKIKTIIPGAWNLLNETHRLSNKSMEIAEEYHDSFLKDKYDKDQIERQFQIDFGSSERDQLNYYYVNSTNNNIFAWV